MHPLFDPTYTSHDGVFNGEVPQVVGDMPTYITFDVDALDPSFAIGTGSPEVINKQMCVCQLTFIYVKVSSG